MRDYYRSKISIPLWNGIWGVLLIIAAFSFNLDFSFSNILQSPAKSISWTFILVFTGTIYFGTGYRIKDKILIIKIGPIVERKVNVLDISSIERSYDLEASPANALKRLKLNYNDRYVLISPSREHEFLKQLTSINPNIVIYNLEKTIKF